ncbi:MAG: hypothetical protein KDC99_12760 [Cyclobacteriaceae bacterium]|nr:hypothetical protein [Cyclobacteriaceae bacterium]
MEDRFIKLVRLAVQAVSLVLAVCALMTIGLIYFQVFYQPSHFEFGETKQLGVVTSIDDVKDGVHLPTGLKVDVNFELVVTNCTGCHSAKLITQNRANADGWSNIITWMQETQNLWDLGEDKSLIVDYLSKNYAPEQQSRRKPLANVEWYELED